MQLICAYITTPSLLPRTAQGPPLRFRHKGAPSHNARWKANWVEAPAREDLSASRVDPSNLIAFPGGGRMILILHPYGWFGLVYRWCTGRRWCSVLQGHSCALAVMKQQHRSILLVAGRLRAIAAERKPCISRGAYVAPFNADVYTTNLTEQLAASHLLTPSTLLLLLLLQQACMAGASAGSLSAGR
jgi:hypothetical protein